MITFSEALRKLCQNAIETLVERMFSITQWTAELICSSNLGS